MCCWFMLSPVVARTCVLPHRSDSPSNPEQTRGMVPRAEVAGCWRAGAACTAAAVAMLVTAWPLSAWCFLGAAQAPLPAQQQVRRTCWPHAVWGWGSAAEVLPQQRQWHQTALACKYTVCWLVLLLPLPPLLLCSRTGSAGLQGGPWVMPLHSSCCCRCCRCCHCHSRCYLPCCCRPCRPCRRCFSCCAGRHLLCRLQQQLGRRQKGHPSAPCWRAAVGTLAADDGGTGGLDMLHV
jgi:hypothetical protein